MMEDLLGNGCSILVQSSSDLSEGVAVIKELLDDASVLKREMLILHGFHSLASRPIRLVVRMIMIPLVFPKVTSRRG